MRFTGLPTTRKRNGIRVGSVAIDSLLVWGVRCGNHALTANRLRVSPDTGRTPAGQKSSHSFQGSQIAGSLVRYRGSIHGHPRKSAAAGRLGSAAQQWMDHNHRGAEGRLLHRFCIEWPVCLRRLCRSRCHSCARRSDRRLAVEKWPSPLNRGVLRVANVSSTFKDPSGLNGQQS